MVATAKGGPDVLMARELPLAWPAGERDVLVRLEAASVNPADVFFRQLGGYLDSGGPLVLGHDGAGVVEAVGSGVVSVRPGDRVAFCNGGIGGAPGTYAEHAVVPERQLAVVPDGLPFETAAALPLIAITAWEALMERAELLPGETVLVHGGAGGTGHMAIQLARDAGAKVATTVSSTEKVRFVEDLGADRAIRYREEDFVAAARDWSGGRGVAVALDNVGGETLLRTYKAMMPYGRVATLMGIAGDDAETTAYNANLSVLNIMMLMPMWYGLTDRLVAQAGIVQRVLAMVAEGRVRVHVAETFPLSRVGDAHRRLEAGGVTGKIVLVKG
jgi:NADPH2:quinone reductase